MGSFIFRCAETKSVLSEGKPVRGSFYLRKIKFGSNNSIVIEPTPIPLASFKGTAQDYGEFIAETDTMKSIINLFSALPLVNAQYASLLFFSMENISSMNEEKMQEFIKTILERNKESMSKKFTWQGITHRGSFDIRDFDISVILNAYNIATTVNDEIIASTFNGICHCASEKAVVLKTNDGYYQVFFSPYKASVISKIKNLTLTTEDGKEVNSKEYIDHLFTKLKTVSNTYDDAWEKAFIEAVGTQWAFIKNEQFKGDIIKLINESNGKPETYIRREMKDFFLWKFFYELGLSAYTMTQGSQDYQDEEARKIHNVIIASIQHQ